MPFYIDEKSFNVESDKKENKWDIGPACCYKQNKQNQKFWNQAHCDSAGSVSGQQKFWIGKLWGPVRNVRGETQKFWVVFRQWAKSHRLCITLKQWVSLRNSVYCQHVKIINSECVRKQRVETSEVQYVWHVGRTQKFCAVLEQWVNHGSSMC